MLIATTPLCAGTYPARRHFGPIVRLGRVPQGVPLHALFAKHPLFHQDSYPLLCDLFWPVLFIPLWLLVSEIRVSLCCGSRSFGFLNMAPPSPREMFRNQPAKEKGSLP